MLVRDISPEKRSGVNMFGTNAFSDGTAQLVGLQAYSRYKIVNLV